MFRVFLLPVHQLESASNPKGGFGHGSRNVSDFSVLSSWRCSLTILVLPDVPHILLTFPRASLSADQWLHHSGRRHLPEGRQRWTRGETVGIPSFRIWTETFLKTLTDQ